MIINGNDPDYTANGIALLWENPDPSVAFPGDQTLELNVNDCASLFVEMLFSHDIQNVLGAVNIHKDAWKMDDTGDTEGEESQSPGYVGNSYSATCVIPFSGSTTAGSFGGDIMILAVASRGVAVSSSGVTFGSCFFTNKLTGGNSVNDSYAIPYRIYGSYYV